MKPISKKNLKCEQKTSLLLNSEVWMSKKHLKRCLTSFITKKTLITGPLIAVILIKFKT